LWLERTSPPSGDRHIIIYLGCHCCKVIFLHVPNRSLCHVHAAFMPVTIWSVNRFPPDLSRANDYLPVLMTSLRFRHFISGSVVFVSIITKRGIEGPPDLVVEVLSPFSAKRDRRQKLYVYAKYLIPELRIFIENWFHI